MKRLLSLAALLVSVLAGPYSDSTLVEWNKYKAAHDKFYQTPEEDARRLETYLANKRKVEEHNSRHQRGETTFTMALNKFSDWFPEELDQFFSLKIDRSMTGGSIHKRRPDADPPKSINWVEKGAVTSVKDQGQCGSCYAFSAAGALEGLMFRSNSTITSLSAQELMDCSKYSFGCHGGFIIDCFETAISKGEETETAYPYEARNDTCRSNENKSVVKCSGYQIIEDEDDLQNVVGSVGPVSIAMAVSNNFVHYNGGVYKGDCASAPNHAMLAVGYGTDEESGMDYWLIKNSWGPVWGEKGYARVKRNVNKCLIGDFATYPV